MVDTKFQQGLASDSFSVSTTWKQLTVSLRCVPTGLQAFLPDFVYLLTAVHRVLLRASRV